MNIEDRLREIIREELAAFVDPLRAALGSRGPSLPAAAVAVAPIAPSRWLSTEEAADLLRLHPKTLANWRAQGNGPPFRRVGRAVRYDRAEIERYIVEEQR